MTAKKIRSQSLTPAEREALQPLVNVTAPFLAEMVGVLVNIARRGRREAIREKAASRVIEIHLMASGQQAAADNAGLGRVVVIQAEQLDRVEAAHRAQLRAEVKQ